MASIVRHPGGFRPVNRRDFTARVGLGVLLGILSGIGGLRSSDDDETEAEKEEKERREEEEQRKNAEKEAEKSNSPAEPDEAEESDAPVEPVPVGKSFSPTGRDQVLAPGLIFDSAFGAMAITAYGGEGSQGQDRIFLQRDPVRPNLRTVARFNVREQDEHSGYPRAQLVTNSFFEAGSDYYIGLSIFAPAASRAVKSPAPDYKGRVLLHEIYGPPFGSGGPNRIFFNDGKYSLTAGGALPFGKTWTMPAPSGWTDFRLHYLLSSDATVGYVSLAVNTGKGWVEQKLPGAPLVDGEYRYYYATFKPGTNDEGKNYSTIKVSFADAKGTLPVFEMIYGAHLVGTTPESVDPHTFG